MNKITNVINYISFLISKHNEIQNQNKEIFRILKTSLNKDNEHLIHIQIINKASTFTCNAIELNNHDDLLNCFSKKDVKIITFLAAKDKYVPKYKIYSFSFNEMLQKIIYKVGFKNKNVVMEVTGEQIYSNKELLMQLNQLDAYRIGFQAGIESTQNDVTK